MKKELRAYYKNERKKNRNFDDNFIDHLLKLVNGYSNIALYMKIGSEVNLEKLINKLFLTKNIYLPVVKGKNLEFRKFTSFNDLSFDEAKILAPVTGDLIDHKQIDMMIIPCLAANYQGYRLGYGGGYYDRILQNYHGLKVGVVFENCLTNLHFQEPFDIPLDILVTEKRIIKITERN